jgi:hypothetical protein
LPSTYKVLISNPIMSKPSNAYFYQTFISNLDLSPGITTGLSWLPDTNGMAVVIYPGPHLAPGSFYLHHGHHFLTVYVSGQGHPRLLLFFSAPPAQPHP